MKLEGQKILITGPSSQVAFPLARTLAPSNEVWGLARFRQNRGRTALEALGIRCIQADLASDSLDSVPDDFDYVLHFAVVRSGRFDYDLAANAEGAGRLMFRCRKARAFLHCSSAAVYAHKGHEPACETDDLGDNHRVMMPTYSLAKIAAEAVVRFSAQQLDLPTTIARFSVPYGNNGGWPWFHLQAMRQGHPIPVHSDPPSLYNPIHEDDYMAHVPRLLEIAAVPPRVINWGGSEPVSIEEWCRYMGELTGIEPRFNPTAQTLGSLTLDLTQMHEQLGRTQVPWRDGIRRMLESLNPELLR